MSFIDLAKKRYSVRKFKSTSPNNDEIMKVLEAGKISPSAVNYQPRHFIVIRDKEIKDKIAATYQRDWIKNAPIIIVVCGDHNKSWLRDDGKDHCDIDVAIAVDHMTLAATDIGLGTCWVCKFDSKMCHNILNLPKNLEVMALLPIGYPENGSTPEKKRNNISELVSFDKYNA